MGEDSRWTIPLVSLMIVASAVLFYRESHTHRHDDCRTHMTIVGVSHDDNNDGDNDMLGNNSLTALISEWKR